MGIEKGGGFTQPCQLSNELGEFLSCDVMPRTEVVKKIWDYIKENDLQNPDDRREIICDLQLQKVFKRKKITMFSMNKLLSPVRPKTSNNANSCNDANSRCIYILDDEGCY